MYGFHIRDIGTDALWWDEALALITEQPPERSAVFRKVFPDKYDRTKVLDRLETLAVLMVRGQHLLGNQTEVETEKLPSSYEELFGKEEERTVEQPERELLTFEEIDEKMGWDRSPLEIVPEPEKLTFEEIDQRLAEQREVGEDDEH